MWRHRGAWWIGLRVALAIYAAVIIGMTFFPFPLTPGPSLFIQPWILPIPLQTILLTIGRGWGSAEVRFLIGNVIGFIPLGVFYPLLRPATHTWRRAILVGLVVSLAIETTQVLLSLVVGYPYRQFDVDDLLLNTLGTALGYGAWRLVRRVRSAP